MTYLKAAPKWRRMIVALVAGAIVLAGAESAIARKGGGGNGDGGKKSHLVEKQKGDSKIGHKHDGDSKKHNDKKQSKDKKKHKSKKPPEKDNCKHSCKEKTKDHDKDKCKDSIKCGEPNGGDKAGGTPPTAPPTKPPTAPPPPPVVRDHDGPNGVPSRGGTSTQDGRDHRRPGNNPPPPAAAPSKPPVPSAPERRLRRQGQAHPRVANRMAHLEVAANRPAIPDTTRRLAVLLAAVIRLVSPQRKRTDINRRPAWCAPCARTMSATALPLASGTLKYLPISQSHLERTRPRTAARAERPQHKGKTSWLTLENAFAALSNWKCPGHRKRWVTVIAGRAARGRADL